MPVKNKTVKYMVTLAGDFVGDVRVQIMNGPEDIERYLVEERGWRLSEHRCPTCGTRLVFTDQVLPVLPEHKDTMFSCYNDGCPEKALFLLKDGKLTVVSPAEWSQWIQERRERNLALLKAGKLKLREEF